MFEFDPQKSESNKLKHGIDFNKAQELWQDSNRVVIEARTVDELRFLLIAELNQNIWSAIYTFRGETIRIISVRKSRENEKAIYHSGRV
jgi:uncharacterized DUF497 family protein